MHATNNGSSLVAHSFLNFVYFWDRQGWSSHTTAAAVFRFGVYYSIMQEFRLWLKQNLCVRFSNSHTLLWDLLLRPSLGVRYCIPSISNKMPKNYQLRSVDCREPIERSLVSVSKFGSLNFSYNRLIPQLK